jgi:arylsulfate sulfotransferase
VKKNLKTLAILLACLLVLGLAISAVVFSGILVRPTDKSLASRVEIPEYDILDFQYQREMEILADYEASEVSFERPYVILDPYEMNPLSALVIFNAPAANTYEVTVKGDDPHTTFTYPKNAGPGRVEIAILGLYPGRENVVTLQAGSGEVAELRITTEKLPQDMQTYVLEKSLPEKMEPGVTLMIACFESSYSVLLDSSGQVRGYFSNQNMGHGTAMITLRNGNLLTTGDELKQVPYNMSSLWELNWLGKIFREIEVPNAVHHNLFEMPDGDILAVSNSKDLFTSGTREDVAILIDRASGNVKKEVDFRKILDEKRDPYTHFHPNILNPPNIDWMHMNTAIYDEVSNAIIVSSPIQSQVVAIDAVSSEIRWILGPHEGYENTSAFLKEYLLTPTGDNFEWSWGQHDPVVLPDFDQNPDTLDLLLLDNGQSRSFVEEKTIQPEDNYSRAVHYRIHLQEKTVEQIWQYGKERGSELYATFLGDAEYLPQTGNRLIDFGGQLSVNGKRTDDILGGVLGTIVTNSRVVEVTEGGEVVFEVSVHENSATSTAETYQAKRQALYSAQSFDYVLGEIQAVRQGQSYLCKPATGVTIPQFYFGNVKVDFNQIHREKGRLIIDGNFTYNDQAYLLSRAVFVFRSREHTYSYAANSGLNGRFFLSVDTAEMEAGTYQLDMVGAVIEGNDAALTDQIQAAQVKTGYKLTID